MAKLEIGELFLPEDAPEPANAEVHYAHEIRAGMRVRVRPHLFLPGRFEGQLINVKLAKTRLAVVSDEPVQRDLFSVTFTDQWVEAQAPAMGYEPYELHMMRCACAACR